MNTILNARTIPILGLALIAAAVVGGLGMQLARGETGRSSAQLCRGVATNDVRMCVDAQLRGVRCSHTVTLIVFPYYGSPPLVPGFETAPALRALKLTVVCASIPMTVLHGPGRVDSPSPRLHVQRAVYRQFLPLCRVLHSAGSAATTTTF